MQVFAAKHLSILILLGASLPAFATNATCLSEPLDSLSWCASADLDGDRLPDLAVASSKTLRVRLSGSTKQEQHLKLPAAAFGLGIRLHDIDGDSDLDVLVSALPDHSHRTIYLNDGDGDFTAATHSSGAYPESAWEDPPTFSAHNPHTSKPLACTAPNTHNSLGEPAQATTAHPLPVFARLAAPQPNTTAQRRAAGRLRIRSPSSLLPF